MFTRHGAARGQPRALQSRPLASDKRISPQNLVGEHFVMSTTQTLIPGYSRSGGSMGCLQQRPEAPDTASQPRGLMTATLSLPLGLSLLPAQAQHGVGTSIGLHFHRVVTAEGKGVFLP